MMTTRHDPQFGSSFIAAGMAGASVKPTGIRPDCVGNAALSGEVRTLLPA
jgi:hypothetical protein